MSISIVRGKQLSALLLFGLVSGQAGAADDPVYGLGAGASGGGTSIYFPIRTGPLIVEPHISYSHNNDTTDGTGTDVTHHPPSQQLPDGTTPIMASQKYTNERMEIALGVFLTNHIVDEIELYYGGRFGYQTDKRRNQRRDDYPAGGGYVHTNGYNYNRKLTGYFLAPTLGLQYFPRPNFSLGIEVSLRYSNLSGHESDTQNQTNNGPDEYSSSRTTSGDADTIYYTTLTAAIIRGYF